MVYVVFLWRTIHESGHLAHRAKKAFTRQEMLEKELALTKLVFDNGGPVSVFNNEYSSSVNAYDRIGVTLYEKIYEYLPWMHEAGTDILNEIQDMNVKGISQPDIEKRLGELIIENKKKYSDFKLNSDGEDVLGNIYYLVFQEAALSAVANIVDFASNDISEGLYQDFSIKHVEKFYSIAGEEDVKLSDLQAKLNDPNLQIDLPNYTIVNK